MELSGDRAQRAYARWLAWGTRVGLASLVLAFVAYLAGAGPHVPIERLPELWAQPAAHLLAQSGSTPGWSWANNLMRSDMLALAAIGLLATCSVPALLAALAAFARDGERSLTAVCLLTVVVLLLAASGWLAVP